MAGKGDIRSFFGATGPSAKKQKVAAAATSDTPNASATRSSDAVDGAIDNVDAAANAVEQVTTTSETATATITATSTDAVRTSADATTATTSTTISSTTTTIDESPIEHSFANLQRNAKALMHASWYEQLEREFTRASFTALVKYLAREESSNKTIYPPPQDVFAALRDCAFPHLKVVILGQDPYHGPNQAHGLSFSVRRGIATPPSLRNIYKEAMSDVHIPKPSHGCLSSWSHQGVLLLNAVLTVRKSEPNAHKKQGWEALTDAIIRCVNRSAHPVVFLLWGKPAQEKRALVTNAHHLVLTSSHPSPLGATKTAEPFIGSKCFSKANAFLTEQGRDPIDWRVV